MSKLTDKYNLRGQHAKMADLSFAMYKAGIRPATHHRGTPEWWAWRGWRKNNGLSVTIMDARDSWGVPSDMPPDCGIDTAIDQAYVSARPKLQE